MKKILIADDEMPIIMVLRAILEAEYEVTEVRSGDELIEAAAAEKPDLIVTDVHMPGISGFEAIEELKKNSDNVDIPVIFISSMLKEKMEYKQKKV